MVAELPGAATAGAMSRPEQEETEEVFDEAQKEAVEGCKTHWSSKERAGTRASPPGHCATAQSVRRGVGEGKAPPTHHEP